MILRVGSPRDFMVRPARNLKAGLLVMGAHSKRSEAGESSSPVSGRARVANVVRSQGHGIYERSKTRPPRTEASSFCSESDLGKALQGIDETCWRVGAMPCSYSSSVRIG